MHAAIPRLPVLDWQTFSGPKNSGTACLLDLPESRYTNSGRASILLALEILEISTGDRVLVPTYHCPTMIAPISLRGAFPVFYPLNSDGSPDLAWIESQDLNGVRAVLAAHFFGLPQPLARLRTWCTQKRIYLIEDCAHALFGSSDGKAVGSWGDLAIASLTKFLPVPEGGCLVNNNPSAAQSKTSLRAPGLKSEIKAAFDILHTGIHHGRLKGLALPFELVLRGMRRLRRQSGARSEFQAEASSEQKSPAQEAYDIDLGMSHQELTAACRWVAQVAPRERIVAGRRAQYTFFAAAFAGAAEFHPLMPALPNDCAPYVFPLWVNDPDPGYFELRRRGLPVSRWDRLWPGVPSIEGDHGRAWSHHILQLACHQDLTPDELGRMVSLVKSVYSPSTRTTSKGEA